MLDNENVNLQRLLLVHNSDLMFSCGVFLPPLYYLQAVTCGEKIAVHQQRLVKLNVDIQ